MLEFNDSSIITGYIKELLGSFNLPNAKVYKENTLLFENSLYIKDDMLMLYKNNSFKPILPYSYNEYIKNYTKTLAVKSLKYDSETHKYLGEYLRFQRDYNHINLMSLYNCFSNELVRYLYKKINDNILFDSSNPDYKIYMIPVKYNQEYTIAIDSTLPYEMFCSYYNKKYYELPTNDIAKKTYIKINNSQYNSPYLFNKLKETYFNRVDGENDLKLFIKLPFSNKSSITVLEGNYTNANSFTIDKDNPYNLNYTYCNLNFEKTDNLNDINLVSRNQLLFLNTKYSYPFSDRLLEYLVDLAITHNEKVSDNIKRLQKSLIKKHSENSNLGIKNIKQHYGIWENDYRGVLYDFAYKTNIVNNKFDVLGYVDKDVESKLNIDDIDIYEGE